MVALRDLRLHASLISIVVLLAASSCTGEDAASPEVEPSIGLHASALSAPAGGQAGPPASQGVPMAPDTFHRRVGAILKAEGVKRVAELSPAGRAAVAVEIAKTPATLKTPKPAALQAHNAKYAALAAHKNQALSTKSSTATKKLQLFGKAP